MIDNEMSDAICSGKTETRPVITDTLYSALADELYGMNMHNSNTRM